MSMHIDGVTIHCRDLKASARFYEETLGFRRGQDLGTMLELFAPTGGWPAQSDPPPPSQITVMLDQIDESTPGTPGGTYGVVMSLSVDDVDAVVEKLRTVGRGVRLEPTDQPYGVRDAAVLDPDGHEVWISGPLKAGA